MELCTFQVAGAYFGVDIQEIQEINRNTSPTPVFGAPEYVGGVMNLRGRVVTVIDLGVKLGLGPSGRAAEARNLVVWSGDEPIALLVDCVADVVATQDGAVEPPPSNLTGALAKFLRGVVQSEGNLVGLLDLDAVLDG